MVFQLHALNASALSVRLCGKPSTAPVARRSLVFPCSIRGIPSAVSPEALRTQPGKWLKGWVIAAGISVFQSELRSSFKDVLSQRIRAVQACLAAIAGFFLFCEGRILTI
jgi:hypothetical protein